MPIDPTSFYGEATRAIHGGLARGETASIHQTAGFAFDSVEQAVARAAHLEEGAFYTRMGNPTTEALESRLALLEGAEACVATASGMGALTALFLGLCGTGDHVVCTDSLYGATYSLLTGPLQRWGLQVSFVDTREPGNVARAIRPDTRLIFLESPSNPSLRLTDLEAVAQLAHDRGARVACDNTFATSVNQQPLRLGVDLVVYSATKYIGGHGDALGGAILGDANAVRILRATEILAGSTPSPLNTFLLLRGAQTLPLRVERHNANALEVARWLSEHSRVQQTIYPGLESHPQHGLARQQMRGYGGMIAFELKDESAARRVANAVRLITLAVSLGDVKSLLAHPASMTHRAVPAQARAEAGITGGLLRLSVGLEDLADILADLEQALEQA